MLTRTKPNTDVIVTRNLQIRKQQPAVDTRQLDFTIVSKDNGGLRFDYESWEYYIEELDPAGADVSELRTFFKDHDRSVDSAIGKVIDTRLEDGELVATVQFGSDEDAQRIYDKYREGILSDVSIGYQINEYVTKESTSQNERTTVSVTSFTIRELSAVGIGFDTGAKKRSQENDNREVLMNEELLKRLAALEAMAERTADDEKELAMLLKQRADEERAELKRIAAERAEMQRVADIEKLAAQHKVSDELRSKAIEDPEYSVERFLRDALAEREAAQTTHVTVGDTANREDLLRDVEDALVMRMGGKVENASRYANQMRVASLTDVARMLTGAPSTEVDRRVLAERAMVTADFPKLLQGAGNRTLEQEFDAAALTYRRFATEQDLPDFRTAEDITRGRGGRLDKLYEGGELKEKQLAESAESWKLESFGNEFILTRQMLINDDLGAFTNMLSLFAEMAGLTANGRVYDLLLARGDFASYVMSDGTAIFDATAHKNVITGALDLVNLGKARKAMREQKGLDGAALNIAPAYLIVGPENEQAAYELVTSPTRPDQINSRVPNFFQGTLEVVVDAEITGNEWFLSAARRGVKVGYLAGTGRRPVLMQKQTSVTGIAYEGVFDFGVMASDYRGLTKGAS